MASPITLDAILAFIGNASWQDTHRIRNAVARRLPDVTFPDYTADQVRKTFAVGSTVEITGLAQESLNGMRVPIVELALTRVIVQVGGSRHRIPASCAIPVDGPPDSAETAPPALGDFVRITTKDALAGSIAIIVGMAKRLHIVLTDGTGRTYGCSPGGLEKIAAPERNPHHLVIFKEEAGNLGSVRLYDTSLIDPKAMIEYGSKPAGITDFGWVKRKEAAIIARAYGAPLQEV